MLLVTISDFTFFVALVLELCSHPEASVILQHPEKSADPDSAGILHVYSLSFTCLISVCCPFY